MLTTTLRLLGEVQRLYGNGKCMSRLEQIKSYIKAKCPVCVSVIKQNLESRYNWKPIASVFSDIYYNRGFGSQGSFSGSGSDLSQTSVIRQEIPILLKGIYAKSLLDAPCGDFHWMKETKLDIDRYIGGDIVPDLIAQNQQKYSCETREFITLDIAKDNLPQVDIILCRDCLVHFSFKDITSTIKNFKKSKSKYLLTTTFTGLSRNSNIFTGQWRPINLQLPPFNFPEPIKLINEKCTEAGGKYSDKSLGLWKFDDVSL